MTKFHRVSLLLGFLLLAFLIWKIGLRVLWQDMTLLGWGLVPLILSEGVVDLVHTLGWRHCLSGPHRALSFFQIFRIRMAGTSINYITPTAGLGGEVTKAALLSLNHQGVEAATGVIIGKLAFSLAQLLLVVIGSLTILWTVHLPAAALAAMRTATILLGGGILALLAVQKYGKLGAVIRWLVTHKVGGKSLEKAAHHITEVDEELKLFYKERPADLPLAVFWHIIGMAFATVQTWYFLFLLTDHASLTTAAAIWVLGSWLDLAGFAIPIDIGVLETTRVIAFTTLGFHSALGLTYGITIRLRHIFWTGVGLLIYATLLGKKEEGGLRLNKEVSDGRPRFIH
jgi:uncharacterized protein (TIRG00374 family)